MHEINLSSPTMPKNLELVNLNDYQHLLDLLLWMPQVVHGENHLIEKYFTTPSQNKHVQVELLIAAKRMVTESGKLYDGNASDVIYKTLLEVATGMRGPLRMKTYRNSIIPIMMQWGVYCAEALGVSLPDKYGTVLADFLLVGDYNSKTDRIVYVDILKEISEGRPIPHCPKNYNALCSMVDWWDRNHKSMGKSIHNDVMDNVRASLEILSTRSKYTLNIEISKLVIRNHCKATMLLETREHFAMQLAAQEEAIHNLFS
jgi:hypothetical protein